MTTIKANLTSYLAAASLIAVFVIDMLTPVYLAVDILYLCCILILFRQNTLTIISFSIAACLLILLNAILESRRSMELTVLFNRLISVGAMFIISYIAIHYRQASKRGTRKEQRYLRALEEMLFITSHQVRKPVANILGIVDMINSDHEHLSPKELKERCNLLYHSATELDDFIRNLNNTLREAEKEHREDLGG